MNWRESSEEIFSFFPFFNHFLSPLINFISPLLLKRLFISSFYALRQRQEKVFFFTKEEKKRMKEVDCYWSSRRWGNDDDAQSPPDLTKEFQFSIHKAVSLSPSLKLPSKKIVLSINQCLKRIFIRWTIPRATLFAKNEFVRDLKVSRPRIFVERWRRLNWNSIARENQQISLKIFFVLVLLLILHCHFNFRWRNHANKALENVRSTFFFVSRLRLKVTINEVLQYFWSLLFLIGEEFEGEG